MTNRYPQLNSETPHLHGFPDLSQAESTEPQVSSSKEISGVELFAAPSKGKAKKSANNRPKSWGNTRLAWQASNQEQDVGKKLELPKEQQHATPLKRVKRSKNENLSPLYTLILPLIWPILWSSLLLLCGGLGFVALTRLTHLPDPFNCQDSATLTTDAAHLHCAKQAVQAGNADQILAGIQLIEQWQPSHPLYEETQALLLRWSTLLLDLAQVQINQGQLEKGVSLAQQIPESSPIHARAQAHIQTWQTEWPQGEAIYAQVQKEIRERNWPIVAAQIQALGKLSTGYWRQQLSQLRQTIRKEKQAESQLNQAKSLAERGDTASLQAAINLTQKVNRQSSLWPTAKLQIDQWSEALVKLGLQHWQKGNLKAAIATVQSVSIDPNRFPEAQDLLQFSHAEQSAARTGGYWLPDNQQIYDLLEAKVAVQKISSDSPLYPQAQEYLNRWQAELQDLTQLQYARLVAGLGHRVTYTWAMQQAHLIELDRPRRKQAQTLIAHWRSEIERLEDQPHLLQAEALAQSETIPAYQAAIVEAQKIAIGRGLRIEAQTQIANWRKQIETIEDQPILNQAQTFASQGQFQQAIQIANKIKPQRALRSRAQANIKNWTSQLQIAEDRPILDQAYQYAARDYLTVAIETAYQIQPGRPLYREAQEGIAIWKERRDILWGVWDGDEGLESQSTAPQDSAADNSGGSPELSNQASPESLTETQSTLP